MKSIEFTDQELDFLRKQYLMELEEAVDIPTKLTTLCRFLLTTISF